jgi:hypothetical protein
MAANPQVTYPCSANSIPFYPNISTRRGIDAAINYGQSSYIDSLLFWQSKIPYYCKVLFNDTLTFQFKTQVNAGSANPSRLYVYNSKVGANGLPVPNQIVAAFTTPLLSGAPYFGVQNAPYDSYFNPRTSTRYNLTTYCWSFSFATYLNYLTDSGIYFIRFDNIDVSGTSTLTFYSEPILVYGVDARYTDTTKTTLLIQAQNTINKSDIIFDGWIHDKIPTFSTRVEGDVLDFDMKGIYLGFLQQNYLQDTTFEQSWKTWLLKIGSPVSLGIPATLFEIVCKLMEMDTTTINNIFYTQDIGNASGGSPTNLWKIKKNRTFQLFSGTLPIREKYPNSSFLTGIGAGRFHAAGFDKPFN